MPYKDIDGKFADKMRMTLYNMTKDLINWKALQRYFSDPLPLYSHKKKCQLLLAFADTTSDMGYKFNADDRDQYIISEQYLRKFKFSNSYKYMKAYRFHFLLDPFNAWPDFDKILKASNNSFEDALMSVNIASMNVISKLANDLSNQTRGFVESVDSDIANNIFQNIDVDYDADESDENAAENEQIERMVIASIVCQNLTEVADRQHCNFMRCMSNLVGLIFDIQSLVALTFDEGYRDIQVKLDEFEQKKVIKHYGRMVEAIVNEITSSAGVPCKTTSSFNRELMKTLKTHSISMVDEKFDFVLNFDLTYEDPIIIHQTK